jgi:hypothetical protein
VGKISDQLPDLVGFNAGMDKTQDSVSPVTKKDY